MTDSTKHITVRLDSPTVARLDSADGTRSAALRRIIDEHRLVMDTAAQGGDVTPLVRALAARWQTDADE